MTIPDSHPVPMIGRTVPDFELPMTGPPGEPRRQARLADYRGRWLIMVFYPRDFSLICPTELTSLSDRLDEFRDRGAELLGISCDTVESHERWLSSPKSAGGLGGLGFPLAGDESGEVSRAYGVYLDFQRVPLRGLFIVDPNGVLQYQVVHNLSVGRSSEEVLRVLSAIQTGGLCAEDWSISKRETIDPTQILGPGRVIAHYRVERVLGSGTFATVYKALDLTLQRDVALKVFKNPSESRGRAALAEARLSASLNHPNVCTIHAVDEDSGASMIAMEYLEGPTLGSLIAEGPKPIEWVSNIARQVAMGLSAAHAHGLVHGDLKPNNVVVNEIGLAKILDFGLARKDLPATSLHETVETFDPSATGISGTPSYMSPEQAQGERPTAPSDVFSFGAVMYEMLTGVKAFTGPNLIQVLNKIVQVQPRAISQGLPAPFDEIVRRALMKDPRDRSTMAEIAAAIPAGDCPLEANPA